MVHVSRCLTQYGRGGVGTDAACSMSSRAHWAGSRVRRVQQVSANVSYATTLLCVHTALSAPKSLPPNDANFILTVDSKMLFVNTHMISGEPQLEVGCEPPLRHAVYISLLCMMCVYCTCTDELAKPRTVGINITKTASVHPHGTRTERQSHLSVTKTASVHPQSSFTKNERQSHLSGSLHLHQAWNFKI